MNYFYRFGLASVLFASSSAFSAIPAEGWYGGLMGTVSYPPSIDFTLPSSTITGINTIITNLNTRLLANGFTTLPLLISNQGELSYRVGGGGGGQIGYRHCNFRFEGELLFNYNNYDKLTIDGLTLKTHQQQAIILSSPTSTATIAPTIDGHTDFGAAFLNLFYDFFDEDNDPTWVPYVGLGIGYAYVQDKLSITYPITITTPPVSTTTSVQRLTVKDSTSTPIAQAIIGISYFYNDDTSFGMDYRYLTTRTIDSLDARLKVHTLNFNFNYSFDD